MFAERRACPVGTHRGDLGEPNAIGRRHVLHVRIHDERVILHVAWLRLRRHMEDRHDLVSPGHSRRVERQTVALYQRVSEVAREVRKDGKYGVPLGRRTGDTNLVQRRV